MRWLFGLVLALVLNLSHAKVIDQVVVFGDSLSDRGNLYEYMNHQLPMSPPYFEGRFTNGEVWVELLVKKLFPANYEEHFLDYAYGGANVASNHKNNDFSLQNQVTKYLKSHEKANQNAIYVIWAGSNNYLDLPYDVQGEVNQVIAGILNSIDRLVAKGAKNFIVVNVPQLDTTPAAIEFESEQELQEMSDLHNQGLHEAMNNLRAQHPNLEVLEYDVAKIMSAIIDNPVGHDFKDAKRTCCEFMQDAGVQTLNLPKELKTSQLMTSVQKLAYAPTKDQCYDYLFFDLYHPTAHAHWLLSEEVYQLLLSRGFRFS
jgi:phospholipase/lecithinase/hemolysin